MTKVSDSNVAAMTKQTSYLLCLMAMVNVKSGAFAARLVCAANRAFAFLLLKKGIVGANRDAIVGLQHVIAKALRVFTAPLSTARGCLLQVLAAPFVVTRLGAWSAIYRVSMQRSAGLEKVDQRLRRLALWASLEARRQVEFSARHVSNYTSTFSPIQGVA